MRHYDRVNHGHLNDGGVNHDYEFLADDGWGLESEADRTQRSMSDGSQQNEPSSNAVKQMSGESRGGLHVESGTRGSERRRARPRTRTSRVGERIALLRDVVLHPGTFAKDVIRGIFLGRR